MSVNVQKEEGVLLVSSSNRDGISPEVQRYARGVIRADDDDSHLSDRAYLAALVNPPGEAVFGVKLD